MGKDLLSVGFLLGVAHRRVAALFLHQLHSVDITPEQWSILYHVTSQEGMIQKSIAEQTYKDKPTITRILHQLELKGYIARVIDKRDRRSFRIFSTEQGQRLIEETLPIEEKVSQDVQNALGEEKYRELLATLLQIQKSFQGN